MAMKLCLPICLLALLGASTGVTAQEHEAQPTPSTAQAPTEHAPSADAAQEVYLVVAGDPAQGEAKAAICATCHGPAGNSTNPAWPKLAGQNADYFVQELKAFKSGARKDPLMSPQVATLSVQDMKDLAAYYAQQTIKPGIADESLVDRGERIYRGGLVEADVPACIACHGPAGKGIAAAGFPLIGGQHALYTLTSLQAYASGERQSKNAIMNDIASHLSEKDMQAVSSYIEGLHLNEGVFKLTP